jgi:hypothetical protein
MHADHGGFVVRTALEYAHVPEVAAVVLDMPTSITHQRIRSRLMVALSNFVNQHELGEVFGTPTDLRLGTNVVQPDILFLSKENMHRAPKPPKSSAMPIWLSRFFQNTASNATDKPNSDSIKTPKFLRIGLSRPKRRNSNSIALLKTGYDMTVAYSSDETLRYEFASGKTFELNLRRLFQ